MRFFSCIVTVCFIGVLVFSCTNAIKDVDTCQSEACAPTGESSCKDDACGNGLCSPLCVCNCCHGFTLNSVTYPATISLLPVFIPNSYLENVSEEMLPSVWQPPKTT